MSGDGAGFSVTALPPAALVDLVGAPVNPVLTIVALKPDERAEMQYHVADGRHGRTDATLDIVEGLRQLALRDGLGICVGQQIVIQAEDIPIEVEGVSWEARSDWQDIRLIPDLYYFQAGGYEDYEPAPVPWDRREPRVIWRGSTTGRLLQLFGDLDDVPRYRLCALAQRLGAVADVGITDVVQAATPADAALIRERLQNEGHLRAFMPFEDMARYRYIIDIDGNSNSWNFMMKLRLGCCVLRVESAWKQWFSDRLTAWIHYVPIHENLSDLSAKVDWCLAHPGESAEIGARGRKFAMDMRFDTERLAAARTVFASRDATAPI